MAKRETAKEKLYKEFKNGNLRYWLESKLDEYTLEHLLKLVLRDNL